MAKTLSRHPLLAVVLLELIYDAFVIAGSFGLSVVFPDLPGYSVTGPSQSLVLVLVSAAGLLVLVAAMGWRTLAGFTLPAQWRDLRLYWLPVVLLAAPFVAGVHPIPLDALGLLVVAYVATAVFEEGMWRGVMLGLLRPTGLWQAVLVSSLLFGPGHLGNSVVRGLSPIIAAQTVGAGVQGVGFAASRLRTNNIWPSLRPPAPVADAIRDWHMGCGTDDPGADHGRTTSLRVRQAEPAHVNGRLAHTMRRTDQRVVEKGEEDGEN